MAEFQDLQRRFSAHLRAPAQVPAPAGIEPRRLEIYRTLFYGNIETALANAYPVLRRVTADGIWHAMVRQFFAQHRNLDPLFSGLAKEFLHYLEAERGLIDGDAPYLLELAHYEWVELALSMAGDDTDAHLADVGGDLLAAAPQLSSLAWTLSYDFPVHRIGPDVLPVHPDAIPTYLIVHRNPQDEVKFVEINAVTARLLQLIEANPLVTGRAHLEQIATELAAPAAEIIRTGLDLLQGLRDRGVVLGTRRP